MNRFVRKPIGWVPWDASKNVPVLPAGTNFGTRSRPPRIYQTERMAQRQSPGEYAKEVFVELFVSDDYEESYGVLPRSSRLAEGK